MYISDLELEEQRENLAGRFQKKYRSNRRLVRTRDTLVDTCLLFGSIILFLIIIEIIFTFLNVEPKISLKGLYTSDPIVGYVNTPNFSVTNQNWFRPYEITINSHGLRGSEFAIEQKNGLRILILGDSMTFGVYVNDNETFCHLLEKEALGKGVTFEVLNGGVDGYWPRNELLWFGSRGISFGPDIVILVLYIGNDVKGEFRKVDDIVVRNGLLYHRNHQVNDEEAASTTALYNWLHTRRIYQFICHKYWTIKKMLDQKKRKETFIFSELFEKKGFPTETDAYGRLLRTIQELANICRGRGIRFVMVLVPTLEQVYFDELNICERDKYDMKRPNRKIIQMARSEGIPILDLLETNDFQLKKDLYLPLERIHLSLQGHEVVAKNLYTFLENQGLFQDVRKKVIN